MSPRYPTPEDPESGFSRYEKPLPDDPMKMRIAANEDDADDVNSNYEPGAPSKTVGGYTTFNGDSGYFPDPETVGAPPPDEDDEEGPGWSEGGPDPYIAQAYPEEDCCSFERKDCLADPTYFPDPGTVGARLVTPKEIENVIIIERETKKFGIANALGLDTKEERPYLFVNTHGGIRRLWTDPSKISPDVYGSDPEAAKWISELSIDIRGTSAINKKRVPFLPIYQLSHRRFSPSIQKIVKHIIESAIRATGLVYIATDNDANGELLAWHVWYLIRRYEIENGLGDDLTRKINRVRFQDLSQSSIQAAFSNPTQIDEALKAEGAAREVATRITSKPFQKLFDNLIGLGRTLKQSKFDTRAIPLTIDDIEAAELESIFEIQEMDLETPPWVLINITLEVEFNNTILNLITTSCDYENIDNFEALEGKKLKIKVINEEREKVEPPQIYNGVTVGLDAHKLLGVDFDYDFYEVLQDLYSYGAITYPNTSCTDLSYEGAEFIREHIAPRVLKSEDIKFTSNNRKKGIREGIRPVINDLRELMAKLPEAARQRIFSRPDRYKLMLDVFDLICRRAVAAELSSAELVRVECKINAPHLAYTGTSRYVHRYGYLAAWKEAPRLYTPILESLCVDENIKKIKDTVSGKIKRVVLYKSLEEDPAELIEIVYDEELDCFIGNPRSIYNSIEGSKKQSYSISGLVNKRFLFRKELDNKKTVINKLTPLGAFVIGITRDLFPELDGFGFTDKAYAATLEKELNEITEIKETAKRQSFIIKTLSKHWERIDRFLPYATSVFKSINDGYKRRGSRVHWLDVSSSMELYPYMLAEINTTFEEILENAIKAEMVNFGNHVVVEVPNANSSIIIWRTNLEAYIKVMIDYDIQNPIENGSYKATWAQTFKCPIETSAISGIYEKCLEVIGSMSNSMRTEEAWIKFLNLNWDDTSMVPQASYPVHRRLVEDEPA